jgi:hypothetical protein
MSHGHPRRRKGPRDSLQTRLSLFLLFSAANYQQATSRFWQKILAADGSTFPRKRVPRVVRLRRSPLNPRFRARARTQALLRGRRVTDLIYFRHLGQIVGKGRRPSASSPPVSARKIQEGLFLSRRSEAAAQSTSAVHSAAMTITRHKRGLQQFQSAQSRSDGAMLLQQLCKFVNSQLLLPMAAVIVPRGKYSLQRGCSPISSIKVCRARERTRLWTQSLPFYWKKLYVMRLAAS